MDKIHLIQDDEIICAVADMCVKANRVLPPDVMAALEGALERESQPQARVILEQLLENAALAEKKQLPLCQDTGLAVFFVELGEQAGVAGGGLRQAIEEGVRLGYGRGFLRKSVCQPLSRQNTGDNTPAVIHFDLVPGAHLKISFMAKGGGSENMSALAMLKPAQGWPDISQMVLEQVRLAGPNPCPPIVIGLGIGGNFEQAAILSKKALLRSLDDENPDQDLAVKEKELLRAVNGLGIGPMGLGGDTTCLGLKILARPCHIASLPAAMTMQCHSARHMSVLL